MNEVQQDRLQIFEEKLQKKEYKECIETAEKLLDSLKTLDQSDSAKLKIKCYTAIGDAHLGLKNFHEALQSFEQARKLAEEKYGVLSEESMQPIFRLEKALRALTALEGGHDSRSVLTSAVLLSAKSSEAASKIEGGKHARTLQGLWAVALDKQIVRGSNPIQSLVEAVIQNLTSSKMETFLARTSIVVSSIGLFGMIVYGVFWWLTHPYPEEQNRIAHGDFRTVNQAHCKTKSAKWSFKPLDGGTVLAWSQDGNAEISGSPMTTGKLGTTVYDGSPLSLANIFLTVFSKQNLLLRWNGYALQDQYGITYYDLSEPEETLVSKMGALKSATQDFYKKRGRYPAPNERNDLSYTNPFTKRPEKIIAFNAKETVVDVNAACKAQNVTPHSGLMVSALSGPKRYLIGAFDRARNPIQTPNGNGLVIVIPNQKPLIPDYPQKINGVVVFDKPVDNLFYLICVHTAFTWILGFLLLGLVGPAIFLASRNWRTATRSTKPSPKVGTPVSR